MRQAVGIVVMWIGVAFLYAPCFYSLGEVYGIPLPHAWTLGAALACIMGGCLIGAPKGWWRDEETDER